MQQLKNYIPNSNFTVKERGHIIGQWDKGPPWSLFYPLLFSAINPYLTYLSIIRMSSALSLNLLCGDLHSIHRYLAIDSFPSAIVWDAKLPITFGLIVSEFTDYVS